MVNGEWWLHTPFLIQFAILIVKIELSVNHNISGVVIRTHAISSPTRSIEKLRFSKMRISTHSCYGVTVICKLGYSPVECLQNAPACQIVLTQNRSICGHHSPVERPSYSPIITITSVPPCPHHLLPSHHNTKCRSLSSPGIAINLPPHPLHRHFTLIQTDTHTLILG